MEDASGKMAIYSLQQTVVYADLTHKPMNGISSAQRSSTVRVLSFATEMGEFGSEQATAFLLISQIPNALPYSESQMERAPMNISINPDCCRDLETSTLVEYKDFCA